MAPSHSLSPTCLVGDGEWGGGALCVSYLFSRGQRVWGGTIIQVPYTGASYPGVEFLIIYPNDPYTTLILVYSSFSVNV